MTVLRVFSDGSGLNSVAAMVLQVEGKIAPYDYFVFANVGEDSEAPETLKYRREVIEPYAALHGLKLVEVWREVRGKRVTLKEATLSGNRSLPIPIVFPGRGYGNRTCTLDWKVNVVNKWIRHDMGAPDVVLGLGYTIDEGARVYKKPEGWHDHQTTRVKGGGWKVGRALGFNLMYEFPLIGQSYNRSDCETALVRAGLPECPGSACWFCPFTGRGEWIDKRRNNDPTYPMAIEFQNQVNAKYQRIRGDHPKASSFVGLHVDGIRLEDVPDQYGLWDKYLDKDSAGCGEECGL